MFTGCIYLEGSAAMTLNDSKLTRCIARAHGGGASLRGESTMTLVDGVAIDHSEALQGMGGGVQMGGVGLIVAPHRTPVVISKNRATRGGGISFMGFLHFRGGTNTLIQENMAQDSGGGLYGFSSSARLKAMFL